MNDTTTEINFKKDDEMYSLLEKTLRKGALKLLNQALELEIQQFLDKHSSIVDEKGHRLIVRNGYYPERDIVTGMGQFSVKVPRVDDRKLPDNESRFTSAILPKYMRKLPSIDNLIPALYLKGVSSNAFQDALSSILGKGAIGLSASNIIRLKKSWETEYDKWSKRRLDGKKYAYIWVDGIHFNIRLENERSCILVIMGADENGNKELISVEDGFRESELSWQEMLKSLKDRGLESPPKLAIGDGALGFWKALSKEFPTTKRQRCWVHKTANILDKMPKKIQPKAKSLIHEVYMAETEKDARTAYKHFVNTYKSKYPKAVNCLTKDEDDLFSFYGFPGIHWTHIRTTNPIESTFATVRLRTKRTKGCGSRMATLTMVWRLCCEAEKRWYKLRGSELIDNVIRGDFFKDGELKEVA